MPCTKCGGINGEHTDTCQTYDNDDLNVIAILKALLRLYGPVHVCLMSNGFNIKADVDGTITDHYKTLLKNTDPTSLAIFVMEAKKRLHELGDTKDTADIDAAAELLADKLTFVWA